MRFYTVLFFSILVSCIAWSADFKPLDVKMGLWETTNTFQTSGMPPVSIPPDALANMTPEQRARVEAMMKGSGNNRTSTVKSCVTREKMNKQEWFNNDNRDCTRTVVSSSSSKLEMRLQCTSNGTKTDGTFRIEALNSENIKGSMQMTSSGGDRPMNMNSNFTSRWIGPNCGDVK